MQKKTSNDDFREDKQRFKPLLVNAARVPRRYILEACNGFLCPMTGIGWCGPCGGGGGYGECGIYTCNVPAEYCITWVS